jgi:hypothetical protein
MARSRYGCKSVAPLNTNEEIDYPERTGAIACATSSTSRALRDAHQSPREKGIRTMCCGSRPGAAIRTSRSPILGRVTIDGSIPVDCRASVSRLQFSARGP